MIKYVYYACTSDNLTIWMIVLYGSKFLMLVIGTFLAWETRHISIPELNDSRYIALSVYNIVVLSTIGVISTQLSPAKLDGSYAIIAGLIIFCTTLTMVFVIIRKVICRG